MGLGGEGEGGAHEQHLEVGLLTMTILTRLTSSISRLDIIIERTPALVCGPARAMRRASAAGESRSTSPSPLATMFVLALVHSTYEGSSAVV